MKSSVYYFSGTGNSYAIAQGIKDRLPETEIYSMTQLAKKITNSEIRDNSDYIGFVLPVYFQNIPEMAAAFIKKLRMNKDAYTYCIINANGLPNKAFKGADKAMKSNGRLLDALFYFDMPGNSVVFFDYSNPQSIRDYRLKMAEHHMDAIVPMIRERIVYRDAVKGSSPYYKSVIDKWMLKYLAKDYFFKVNDNCQMCGECVAHCPVNNIEIKRKAVKWKRQCMHCWGCLNRCPYQAIENVGTEGLPRYVHPMLKRKHQL